MAAAQLEEQAAAGLETAAATAAQGAAAQAAGQTIGLRAAAARAVTPAPAVRALMAETTPLLRATVLAARVVAVEPATVCMVATVVAALVF